MPTLHVATEPQSAVPYPWCLVNGPSPPPPLVLSLGWEGRELATPGQCGSPVWIPKGPTVSPGPLRLAAAL